MASLRGFSTLGEQPESVTVVIPTLDAEQNIPNLVTSVYNQNYRPIEIIVVDGGSTDGTVKAVTALASKLQSESFSICLSMEGPDVRSPANARNIGILNATSHYLLFFDSDFELTDRSLISEVKRELEQHQAVGVRVIPKIDTWLELHCAFDDFRKDLGSNVHSYCGYRREIFDRVMFDSRLGFADDRDFDARSGILPAYADVSCHRHFIHTFGQWRRQALWYGGTFPAFLRKYWRVFDPRKFSINPLAQLAWRTANLGLLLLTIAGMLFNPVFSIVPLTLFVARLVYLYVRSAKKGHTRLGYLLLRETYYAFWFAAGLLLGLRSGTRRSEKRNQALSLGHSLISCGNHQDQRFPELVRS
jgi:glycosyltransferase involved in cell wall biosynthesis